MTGVEATGNSGLPSEALAAAPSIVSWHLLEVFSFCWLNATVSTAWKKARIFPVHKKDL